jgi:hypothetical protein
MIGVLAASVITSKKSLINQVINQSSYQLWKLSTSQASQAIQATKRSALSRLTPE